MTLKHNATEIPRKQRRVHFLPPPFGGSTVASRTSCGMIVRASSGFPTTTERDEVNCTNCLSHMMKRVDA